MPATNGKPAGRFELPQLTPVNFSLTDGTNIPPPPDSPIEEKPPAPEPEAISPAPATNGQSATATNVNGEYDGRGRTSAQGISREQQPTSPVSSKRPSSIRRFLSRKSLNMNYTNGTNSNVSNEDVTMIDRPESSMSFASTRPSIAKMKSKSWFRRFSSSTEPVDRSDGAQSRTSIIYEDKQSTPRPMGPPPPKLPELKNLRAKIPDTDDGSLGAEDMFKNIK